MNRKGFILYLTFLVTTVVFMLVTGSQTISRISLDMGRTDVLETIVFHAADGGIEKGLAYLRNKFAPFELSSQYKLDGNRTIEINVQALADGENLNLKSEASLFEGKSLLIKKVYVRNNIENKSGRNGIGRFMEVR